MQFRPTPEPTTQRYPSYYTPSKEMVAWPMSNIRHQECGHNQFKCESVHQCIPKTKVCDLQNDCVDHSDEKGCKCLDYITRLENQVSLAKTS